MRKQKNTSSDREEDSENDILSLLMDMCENRPSRHLAKGKADRSGETIKRIIDAAHIVFVNEGHAGLSLRKVADEAGIAVGNLTYHFPSKRSLLDALLDETVADYGEQHLQQFDPKRDTPKDALMNVVEFYVHNARQSHRFFLQMWSYAASDDYGKTRVLEIYKPISKLFYSLVKNANPKLSDKQIKEAVLQISVLEEGYKLFLGMNDKISAKAAGNQIRALTERIVFPD